jgi:hypothetical protein
MILLLSYQYPFNQISNHNPKPDPDPCKKFTDPDSGDKIPTDPVQEHWATYIMEQCCGSGIWDPMLFTLWVWEPDPG